ncbi:MAG: hypothetical protein U0231_10305 [Nitrospiraceae bacterium]
MSISLGTRLLIWMICSAMVLPPALLAQTLPVPLPGLGSAGASAGSPVAPSIPFGAGALGLYGLQGSPGQPIVTNPTALQPLTPTQTPCPTRPTADLSPESTIPNLNDYWPLEPRSLLPGSVEQRLRQEQEELDRKQETLRVQKERRELEYQAQVEREKQTLARRPGQAGIPGALVPMLPGQQVPSADQRAPLTVQDAEKKPFTGELLRAQDFSIEEAFAQFSILQGVKSRLKQFGYEFFDANANTFSPVQDVPVGPDYVIGPQDSLGVHIWNVPDQSFNRSYIAPVERDGMLVLPQVGRSRSAAKRLSKPKRRSVPGSVRCSSGSNYTCRWRVSGR